jgi:hypothetical protein
VEAIDHNNPDMVKKWAVKFLTFLFVIIIVILPFHGFLTTWMGSSFGNLLLWRAWKEILLLLAVCISAYLMFADRDLLKKLWQRPVNKLIVGFTIWMLVGTLLFNRDADSALQGLTIQLRFGFILIIAQILEHYQRFTRRQLSLLIIIPASVVVAFGLLQMFVLPFDFLENFGYVKNVTIPPYFTVDEQLTNLRIASTLRGPNPLGAYLILPILLLLSYWHKIRPNHVWLYGWYALFLITVSIVLYGTHSRGAWIGLIGAVGVWLLLSLRSKTRMILFVVGVMSLAVTGLVLYQQRDTNFVRDVILHDDPEEGGEVSSNQGHYEALKMGLADLRKRPLFGCGSGCAGPASVRNANGAKISENFFIQTAQEGGLIALLLQTTVFIQVGLLLLRHNGVFERALLASGVGVSIVGLFAHAWADDTIAYLWWGVAGYIVYNKTKGKQTNGQKKKITYQTSR